MALRDEVLKELEGLRKDQKINSNQEASVEIEVADEQLLAFIEEIGIATFATLCIVSDVKIKKGRDYIKVTAAKCPYAKCERCWNYGPTVGQTADKPDLCRRCAAVVS